MFCLLKQLASDSIARNIGQNIKRKISECYLIERTSSAVKVPSKKYISFALNGIKLHVCLSSLL